MPFKKMEYVVKCVLTKKLDTILCNFKNLSGHLLL